MKQEALSNLATRVGNDFYVGVVGSVRSGKSSFINRFFNLKILPYIKDEYVKNKILDELPQSAEGKTIMTVEPKFIPSTFINVDISDDINMNVRLVDSVGYIIPSALGYETEDGPRLVKTPWFDEPIPFKEAATIGTKKVINNHANFAVVVTSDGSITDFNQDEYKVVEDEIIPQLLELEKPFVVVVNSKNPSGKKALAIKERLESTYNISVVCLDVIKMEEQELDLVFSKALEEFKINELLLELPDYLDVLGDDIKIKVEINDVIKNVSAKYTKIKEIQDLVSSLKDSNLFKDVTVTLTDPSSGNATIKLELDDKNYQDIICDILETDVITKKEFIKQLYDGKKAKKVYDNIGGALEMAKETGYGISIPSLDEMKLLPPTLIKQNGRYGVKLSAIAPSIHLIKVDVESSFSPIIGSEVQSQMLIENLVTEDQDPQEVWDKEIFGRRLSEIVNDGIKAKIYQMPDKSKVRLQNVIDKLVNNSNNGLIAIIL